MYNDLTRTTMYGRWIVLIGLYCSSAYIIPSGKEPACLSVSCENGGTLQKESCQCVCTDEYTGLLCETAIGHSEWPRGDYGLPTSTFGCPEEDRFGWKTGHINLTLPVTSRAQLWNDLLDYTLEPHIMGPFHTHIMQLNFCLRKNSSQSNATDENWPPGEYCLYKVGDMCPSENFTEGSITVRGYEFNVRDLGGELPNVTYHAGNSSLQLHFCCRYDGPAYDTITLPNTFPFILFKGSTSSTCQNVDQMNSKEEFFFMTNEIVNWEFNGEFPNVNKSGRHVGIPYCYYEPIARRECYYESDKGASYNGRHNVTEKGLACVPWSSMPDGFYNNSVQWHYEVEENFCKNMDLEYYSLKPMCFVNTQWIRQYCDVPKCEELPGLAFIEPLKPVYSSEFVDANNPYFAVDGIEHGSSFVAFRPQVKPFLQVDLQEWYEVHAIQVYRAVVWFPVNFRSVGTFVSKEQWDFLDYGATRCDDIRFPARKMSFRFQCKRPIIGQFVTVRNFDDTNPTSGYGKFNILEITEIKVLGKRARCGQTMGMISGDLFEYQINSSSNFDMTVNANDGRLLLPETGWCPSDEDVRPWFLVDLIVPTIIQGLRIQGWDEKGDRKLVKSFILRYGNDFHNLQSYEDPRGIVKVFDTFDHYASSGVQQFLLRHELLTRFVMIDIQGVKSQACLKLELVGCPKRFMRDIRCGAGTMDFGFAELQYLSMWKMPMEGDTFNVTHSLEECRQHALDLGRITYYYEEELQECKVFSIHRYQREFTTSWVRYTDPTRFTGERFCLQGVVEISDCGGNITLPTTGYMTLFSPSFPFSYGQNAYCMWTVQASPGKYPDLEIVFLSLADRVKWNYKSQDVLTGDTTICSDTLKIYDDSAKPTIISDERTNSLQLFKKSKIVASYSILYIELRSCIQYQIARERTFEFLFKQSDIPGCGMTSGTCIGTCTRPAAYIGTIGYPSDISLLTTCSWKIEGTFGVYIRFEILNLDIIDGQNSCEKSFLSVNDVQIDGRTQTLLAKMCKNKRVYYELTSSWHYMQIEFRAGDGQGRGFLGKYEMVDSIQTTYNITEDDCQPGWINFEESCYKFFSETGPMSGVTWIQARDRCHDVGGYLASIGSKTEMTFIHYLMTKIWDHSDNGEAYIGLQKLQVDGAIQYEWLDGSALTYTAWYKDAITQKSQPDGLLSERCTVIRLGSIRTIDNWHDIACAYDQIPSYICEKDSQSSTEESATIDILPITFTTTQANNSVFVCSDGEFILRSFRCDGWGDCHDNSDELDCGPILSSCGPSQFQCDNGQCVSLALYCDFIPHCADGSDEKSCVYAPCKEGESRCDNGQCIDDEFVCDLKEDCRDGTDEKSCDTNTCRSPNFLCYDQTCIRDSRRCDGTIDCSGLLYEDENQQCQLSVHESCSSLLGIGIDEDGEYMVTLGTQYPVKVECQFQATSGNKTLVRTIIHHDQEEEVIVREEALARDLTYNIPWSYIDHIKRDSVCHQRFSFSCHMTFNRNFGYYGRDLVWHVSAYEGKSNGTCSCPLFEKCDTPLPSCNCSAEENVWYEAGINDVFYDTGIISSQSKLPLLHYEVEILGGVELYNSFTVGPLVCEHEERSFSKAFICRSGIVMDNIYICILDYDEYGEIKGCSDLSHLDDCDGFECPSDYVKCGRGYCIPVRYICDGISHCSVGEDEKNCNRSCADLFSCHGNDVCVSQSQVCDGAKHCPEGDDEMLCDEDCLSGCTCRDLDVACSNIDSNQTANVILNTNVRKLSIRNSNFTAGIPVLETFMLAELDLSSNQISNIPSNTFTYLRNLYHLDLSYNNLRVILANTFENLHKLVSLNLEGNTNLKTIEPDALRGLAMLPEINIRQTKLRVLSAGTFAGLRDLMVMNLTDNQLEEVDDNAFAMLQKLSVLDIRGNKISKFSKGIFNGLSSLKKVYTDAYMFCCLKPVTVSDANCIPYQDEFSSCSDLMREDHLKAFIWIIGICALIGNAGVVMYKIMFDRRSLVKGHGILILNLAIADFVMGIYMLIIAIADSVYRGRYIWNDVYWRNSLQCKLAGVLATISSEASVMFLLLITLDRFLSMKFLFRQHRLNKRKIILACLIVWILCVTVAVVPLLPLSYFSGQFYSRSAVCLALPLTRDKPAGWEYGTAVFIILNFVIFICIAVGQILIYREVSTSDQVLKSQRRVQDAAIARSLFLVVFSDFLCWFPLGLMGILAFSGNRISSEVYAWTAVFILPINSALNPILYTYSGIRRQKSSRQMSKKNHFNRTSSSFASQYSKWLDICDSGHFVIGSSIPCHVTLRDYMRTTAPSVRHMYVIVTDVTAHIRFLHRRNLAHCRLTEDTIIVNIVRACPRAFSRLHSTIVEEETNDGSNDMERLGKLTRIMLHWYQKSRR